MSNSIIDISNTIVISLTSAGAVLGQPNINTAAIFTQEAPSGWAGGQTYGVYKTASAVATDFGANSSAAAMAADFFSQSPNPLLTSGYLLIIPRLHPAAWETVREAIIRMKDVVFFYGILMDEELGTSDASEFSALATYCESIGKTLFYASSAITDLLPGSVLDLVRQAIQNHTRCFYYGNAILNGAAVQQTQRFAAAYAGRALSVDFTGSKTATTMHLKQLANITPDTTLNQTYLTQAQTAGVDVYINESGYSCLFTSGANVFFDEVYNKDWLKFALQTNGFNYLAGSNTKIPQTEEGMAGLKDAYRKAAVLAVKNGVAAPGSWTASDTFGDPVSLRKNITDIGYYIYSSPVADQSAADRADRKAPLIQIALKLAGAIHSSSVLVVVNE
jgi:hypothetical protein